MSFYTDVIQKSPLFHTTNMVNSLDLLFPAFKSKVEALMVESAAAGQPLKILETYRSNERQVQLFNQHATKLKNVGVHHYGLACDIVKLVHGQPSFEGDYTFLCELATKHGLISGANWGTPKAVHTFKDMDHVQFVSVKDQNKLFNGSWYPDANYDPYQNL